jgi:hypothetical protein
MWQLKKLKFENQSSRAEMSACGSNWTLVAPAMSAFGAIATLAGRLSQFSHPLVQANPIGTFCVHQRSGNIVPGH